MPVTAAEAAVRKAFAEQAQWCRSLQSPLTAELCDAMATQRWPDSAVIRRFREWPGDPRASADAVPLRLCGGLHALVRAGMAPALAACYPPYPAVDAATMWPAIAEALIQPGLAPWLDGPPQTNEVGRSAALIAGLLEFLARHPCDLELFELGASAGLNLQLDRFQFRLGDHHIGDTASRVSITPEWHGPPPPANNLTIVARAGVDRRPVDPVGDGDRLLAFVWADQSARLRQLEGALAIARAHPIPIDRDDAAPWLERELARPPRPGVGRVIMHSIAFQYFSPVTQQRVSDSITRAGIQATADAPLGWLRFERDGPGRDAYIRLRLWPGGDDHLLGRSHPHGASISWRGLPGR